MVSIASFTHHLSNSLFESDIITSTWNRYSMTKFLSIKPPVGVLSPFCLPETVKLFLGWMLEHVKFYLICLPNGFGGWSSEVVGSQLGESILAIVPSLLLLFEILLNQLNQYLFLSLIKKFKTFWRNVGYSSQCYYGVRNNKMVIFSYEL